MKHFSRAEARDRQVHDLTVGERLTADGKLRRVGIDLDRARLLPDGELGEAGSGAFGADEVRDASVRTGEALHAVAAPAAARPSGEDPPWSCVRPHAALHRAGGRYTSDKKRSQRNRELTRRRQRSASRQTAADVGRSARVGARRRGSRCAPPCDAAAARCGPSRASSAAGTRAPRPRAKPPCTQLVDELLHLRAPSGMKPTNTPPARARRAACGTTRHGSGQVDDHAVDVASRRSLRRRRPA